MKRQPCTDSEQALRLAREHGFLTPLGPFQEVLDSLGDAPAR
jgi:hypothetical protein